MKLLWAALMAAITLHTSDSLAQTVWENFSKKKLDKYENIVHKQQRKSTDVADAATTHHMGKRKVVKMLGEETNFMIQKVLPKLVVDHTTFKAYLVKWLQENNVLEFLLYDESNVGLKTISQELSASVIKYETTDIVSNSIKYPINLASQYTESLGDEYSNQTKIIKSSFDPAAEDIRNLFKTGKAKVWFSSNEDYDDFKKADTTITHYVVKTETSSDKLKGWYVYFDFNMENVDKTNSSIVFKNKTELMKRVIERILYYRIVASKYDQIKKMIDVKSKDATTDNK